jgi:hypothetical protein
MLADGESALAFGWARVQKFGTTLWTFYPIGTVIRSVDLVRNQLHLTKLRRTTLDGGSPSTTTWPWW